MSAIIQLLRGDITKVEVDVIVNAANSSLSGGGGVDGAIHRAGGAAILAECKTWRVVHGSCPTGGVVMTTAGDMPAKKVIHTVGPVWYGGKQNEAKLLHNCYVHSLQLADDQQYTSIAFPNISTGIYGYPKEPAAEITVKAVRNFQPKYLEKILLVCFDQENYSIYQKLLNK